MLLVVIDKATGGWPLTPIGPTPGDEALILEALLMGLLLLMMHY